MHNDRDWNWIERFFGRVSAKHQRRVSVSIFILLYCFFILFSVKLVRYNLDFHRQIVAISSCILVALQMSGINHFIKKIKNLFEVQIKAVENIELLYDQLSTHFITSWKKYLIIFSVIAPFILIRANDVINGRIIFFFIKLKLHFGLYCSIPITKLLSILFFICWQSTFGLCLISPGC